VAIDKSVLSLQCEVPFKLMSEEAAARPSEIAALTARMAKGDEGAYGRFFELYFNRLLRYLLVVTAGDEETARDSLQGTFLRVVRHIKPFESEEVFWSWLTVLARSSVIDEQRKAKRYRGLLQRLFQPAEPASLSTAAAGEDADGRMLGLLDSTLATLDVEDRDLIQRKYFTKQSVRDIALDLGLTEKAIESRLVRIRRHLKEHLMKELRHEN
jgi:RNA polymerase sigma factor (sigma-70 family)